MTDRQQEILNWIKEYRLKGDGSPTYREIADRFKVAVGTIQTTLAYLEKDGHITVKKGVPRSIRVTTV